MKKKVIIVYGPTASGKTKLAVDLAKDLNGELISADSRQIYKFLPIGTNVGPVQEISLYENLSFQSAFDLKLHTIEDIPIHLIQFLNPDQKFDVFSWKTLAEGFIVDIISRGKQPIIVGGTGLYIDALVNDYTETDENIDEQYREYLNNLSVIELQELIKHKSPEIENEINRSDWMNPRRLVRKVEKMGDPPRTPLVGHPSKGGELLFDFVQPEYEWEELKERINRRVDEMFEEGLVKEVKSVQMLGYGKDSIALQGIGFREVLTYLKGEITLEACIALVATAHRQYAKRQITWFKKFIG